MMRALSGKRAAAPARSFTPARPDRLQRKCGCGGAAAGKCGECAKKESQLQRRSAGGAGPQAVPTVVNEVVGSAGRPLDAPTRTFMESKLGHDFSRVRVHTDARAAESARAVGAVAYTVGRDIAFDTGRYAPGTREGRQLLAHELTHVAQQGQSGAPSGVQAATSVSDAGDPAEVEAEHFAREAADGREPGPPRERGAATLHRQGPEGDAKAAPEGAEQAGPKGDEVVLSSELRLKTSMVAMMLAYCDQGKLDPLKCASLRLDLDRALRGPAAGKSVFGQPPLTLGPRPDTPAAPDFRKLMDDMRQQINKPPLLGEPGAAPAAPQQKPWLQTPAAPAAPPAGKLPDIGLSKLTTHTIDIRIGTIRVVIPKSVEMKSKVFPFLFDTSLQIGIGGEITELARVFEMFKGDEGAPKQPAPGAAPAPEKGPPVKLTLSVTAGKMRFFDSVALSASYDASSKSFSGGLSFKIVGRDCQMVVPAAAMRNIQKAEAILKKYSPGAAQAAGEKPGAPPADDAGKAFEIVELVDTLYSAIKAVEDAKKKCTRGPTFSFGPTVTVGPGGKPSVGAGFKVEF